MRASLHMFGCALGAVLATASCEAVTGFNDLEFVPEPCEPDPPEVVCRSIGCGQVTDHCDGIVECPDVCVSPYACGVGDVGPNQCGCTGGSHPTPPAPQGCTTLFDSQTQKTYYQCGSAGWDDARAICRSFGTDLAVVKTLQENEYLRINMFAKSWLGLYDDTGCGPPPDRCTFVWVDGSPEMGMFTHWSTGEPNNSTGGEFCVEIYKDGNTSGEWNDATCANVANVVCEPTCPDGT